jgi:RES domain-containing protein
VKQAEVPEYVYRVGRRPDPWAWPDWAHAGRDGTFGNRYDDPGAVYRVLYASSERAGTFLETLARFRPDPEVVAELRKIVGQPGEEEPIAAGVVPADWLANRCMGVGRLAGRYVEIGAAETLAQLRFALAARLVHHRIADLDAAAIRLSVPRRFTQEVSRHLFEMTDAGQRRWDGIAYLSRLGDDMHNWALFEPHVPVDQRVDLIDPDDPDLDAALALLELRLEDGP